jgi:hypothetical protein
VEQEVEGKCCVVVGGKNDCGSEKGEKGGAEVDKFDKLKGFEIEEEEEKGTGLKLETS